VALSRSRGIGAIALIVALTLGLGSSVVLAPGADAVVSISMLSVVDGSVLIRHGAGGFAPARAGDVVSEGDTLRTAAHASAEITYFDGSTVRLEEGTELAVESLRTEPDGGTVIGVLQTLGRSWHVVTKLIEGSSRYEVRTPSSTASVRGTIFAVDVRLDGDGPSATVTTSEGVVVHSAIDPSTATLSEVRVGAGQESTKSSKAPAERAHPAAPEILREAPVRPAPRPTKTPHESPDRVAVVGAARPADQVRVQADPRDRAKSSKNAKQRPGGGD